MDYQDPVVAGLVEQADAYFIANGDFIHWDGAAGQHAVLGKRDGNDVVLSVYGTAQARALGLVETPPAPPLSADNPPDPIIDPTLPPPPPLDELLRGEEEPDEFVPPEAEPVKAAKGGDTSAALDELLK